MKIRSITYFMNVGWPFKEEGIQKAGIFLSTARSAFESAGYEVQTTRIASVPFTTLLGADAISLTPRFAQKLSNSIAANGIDFASLGPALPDVPESYEMIPDAIAASKNIFFSGIMASMHDGINLSAVRACAEVIIRNATISPDGFANLRFAALANVNPGGPFFPAAYHDGDQPIFALALESADLAEDAFSNAKTIEEGRKALINELENHARKLPMPPSLSNFASMLSLVELIFRLHLFQRMAARLVLLLNRWALPDLVSTDLSRRPVY